MGKNPFDYMITIAHTGKAEDVKAFRTKGKEDSDIAAEIHNAYAHLNGTRTAFNVFPIMANDKLGAFTPADDEAKKIFLTIHFN